MTAAKGFAAAAAAAHIKYENRKDMALIYSARPCAAAGTFTTNVVKAAPVIWDRDIVESGRAVHGVVINAGIANAGHSFPWSASGRGSRQWCRGFRKPLRRDMPRQRRS